MVSVYGDLMNSYNGYTPSERTRALKWFRARQAEGFKARHPDKCDMCGQTHGHLEWHSENYSEPFGEHIGEFGLCYMCHMMIHCRFKSSKAWNMYGLSLREGKLFNSLGGRNWVKFKQKCLIGLFNDLSYEVNPSTNDNLWQEINSGKYTRQ